MKLIIFLAAIIASLPALAEPGNAPDTKGHFVLVVGGSYTMPLPGFHEAPNTPTFGFPIYEQNSAVTRIQPFVIGGFTSFKLCVGAGKELQARLNTDGYVLDFACVATGR